jgi:2-oxo-hept-3-ene-1,7-dioate hydratase
MTPEEIEAAAMALFSAEVTGRQMGLLSSAFPDMTLDHAYAVQSALVAKKVETGRRIVGWKIGLTSRAMQDALKIDTPDSGVLFDDMAFESGDKVPKGRFIQPRIEAEIAFVMKSDLAGEVRREDVLAATDYICPSLEILDTRILRSDPETGAARRIVDTVSDNAANAGFVLGAARHASEAVDMRWTGAIVTRNGEVEETGLGAGVLNDPVTAVVWLAERLSAHGMAIRAGDVVLSGSFIRPVETASGDRFDADFGAFGDVRIDFA